MRVAITGANGLVGRVLQRGLADRFEIRPLTRRDADVTDLEALVRVFDGMEAVVHLAANSAVDAAWVDLVGPNLIGARNAFEAAHRAGTGRVVFASTNHVAGMYLWDDDRFTDPRRPVEVAADDPIRPDSLYGATKAWGEAIGRLYAERQGLRVVCLRIGWVREDDTPPPLAEIRIEPARVAARAPGMWLSQRDCVSLVAAALTADVRFTIVHGVSDNAGRWFSLEEGRRHLGWEPRDGA